MGQFVKPSVYHTGYTEVNVDELIRYLKDSDNEEFLGDWAEAMEAGISPAEALCSVYAKLCYQSLTTKHNANISKTRPIKDNLVGCFDHGHGSVFEHVGFSFIIRNCSRVFTHELVRHRVGSAFSQTSGRYCRGDEINLVFDPILTPAMATIKAAIADLEDNYEEACSILGLLGVEAAERYLHGEEMMPDEIKRVAAERVALCKDFGYRKKVTSALRRILPNGQSNEIAFSCNIRTLRHCTQVRTSRFAEWEIREVFHQIYHAVKAKYPMVFYGAVETEVDGLTEVSGMKLQPYDTPLVHLPPIELLEEVRRRNFEFKTQDEQDRFLSLLNVQLEELKLAA